MVTIELSPADERRIREHLFSAPTEQVGFLLLREHDSAYVLEEYYPVPSRGLVQPSPFHAEVAEDEQARVINMAARRGLMLAEVHSHPGASVAEFSASDLAGFAEFVPHVRWRLRQHVYMALVFAGDSFDGLYWGDGEDPADSVCFRVNGHALQSTGRTIAALRRTREEDQKRYSRQSALFGERGQEAIRRVRVGIVGCGGLGAHVVQQLAYLGVHDFVLVDGDTCETSNLNRLVGAITSDVGRAKTSVLARQIRALQPRARISEVTEGFPSALAAQVLERTDVIFGCMDNDTGRLALLDYTCSRRRPYIDLASDAERGFGGRVVFTGLGKGCLFCRGEIDQKELWNKGASDAQRREDAAIYGVRKEDLGSSGPAVVSINAVVASLAVTEFTMFVTGLRAPVPHLTYRGEIGIVTKAEPPPTSTCYYCGDLWAVGGAG